MAKAKVDFKVSSAQAKNFSEITRSDGLAAQLEAIASPILASARRDPNEYYVSTLQMHRFYSRGSAGRVSIQVGAEPTIGFRVEAKRGTLARALGQAGL